MEKCKVSNEITFKVKLAKEECSIVLFVKNESNKFIKLKNRLSIEAISNNVQFRVDECIRQ